MKKIVSYAIDGVLILLVTVGIILMLEGGASMWAAYVNLKKNAAEPISERKHTQYDKELGWINIPNFYAEDVYGPGGYMKTNGQSFRNKEDIPPEIPIGLDRIVCSGDSFTMGVGVSNDETWCHLLSGLFANLQTVNMGQGGYGIDQAYLWYKRDGLKLDHDVQIFSFITDDFRRLMSPEFMGYGKPMLQQTAEGELKVMNVPVPSASYVSPWATRNRNLLKEFALFNMIHNYLTWRAAEKQRELGARASWQQLAREVLRDLKRMNDEKGSRLLIVYIPVEPDRTDNSADVYRNFVKAETRAQGIEFLDLVEAIRKMPVPEVSTLYLRGIGCGHFNRSGNRWMAEQIGEKLMAMKLVQPGPQPSSDNVWQTDYFGNPNLAGKPVMSRPEHAVDHNWGRSSPPGLPHDGFSIRWRSCLKTLKSESIELFLGSDDGSRIFIDGELVLDHWRPHGYSSVSARHTLAPGDHLITVEYFDSGFDASVDLKAKIGDGFPEIWTGPRLRLPGIAGDQTCQR